MKRFLIYFTLFFSFLLGSRNGFIALWTDPEREPVCVFPTQVTSLPQADRAALEKGIHLESREELNRLLEDYLS